MAIVVKKSRQFTGAAFVGYRNAVVDADAITATTADADFPVTNLKNWKTHSRWKGTSAATHEIIVTPAGGGPVVVDSWGIFQHNFSDIAANILFSWSDTGAAGPWTSLEPSFTVDTNRCVFNVSDTPVNARALKLTLTGMTGNPILGILFFGQAMQLATGMEPPFSPPALAPEPVILNNESEGGLYLGRRVIRQGGKSGFTLSLLAPSWVRDTWDPFRRHFEKYPFLFTWDSNEFPDEAAYCFTDGKIRKPTYNDPVTMSAGIDFVCLTES